MAIQDSGSVTDAAEALFVTQAAISKTITEIEDALGTNLFVRRGRGIVATEAGLRFIESGRRIFAEMKVCVDEIDQLSKGLSGRVVIGSSAVSAHLLNARVVAAIKRDLPRINICLLDDYGPDVLSDLRSGAVDLAVAPLIPTNLAPDLEGIPIVYADPIVVASIGHPALSVDATDWPSLMKYAWCLPPSFSRWRVHFEDHLSQMGLQSPENLVESPSALTLLALLRTMPMLTALPRAMAETWEKQGSLVILPHVVPMVAQPIGLIWSTKFPLTPAARVFREAVISELGNTEAL